MTASYLAPRRLITERTEHPLGVGCRPIGGPATNQNRPVGWAEVADSGSAVDTLLRAHALGATVFDASDVYGLGHSQRVLGRMLAQVPRESVRITSTIGNYKGTGEHPYSALNLFRQVEQAQENFGARRVDVLVLAHTDFGPEDRYLDEARDTLQALRDSGDVTALGMTVPAILVADPPASGPRVGRRGCRMRHDFLVEQLGPQVLSTAAFPPEPSSGAAAAGAESVFAFARRHGAATMVHEPLLHGLLTGKYGPDSAFASGDVRSQYSPSIRGLIDRGLDGLRERFGADPQTLARIALHYALRSCPDSIVLAGVSSAEQATENFAGLSTEVSDHDYLFAHRSFMTVYAALARHAQSAERLHQLPARA
ncbi:aldo/keto reductase [Streptomyces sp. NPDC057682]|uniref:aldo/keto reductase n=1 Tax=Streptomyces sp. NPDC057682 TaxID=3346210 RepID=UPI0036B8D6C4